MHIASEARPAVGLPGIDPNEPVVVGLPPRPTTYVERREYLDAFPLIGAGITRYALVGPSGSGKTQIALDFAYRASKYDISTIVWLDGTDLGASAMNVARGIGWAQGEESEADVARMIQRWVSRRPGNWLVVVDGVDGDAGAISEVLPILCRSEGSGRTIVTATDFESVRQFTDGSPIRVGPMTLDESRHVLGEAAPDVIEFGARRPVLLRMLLANKANLGEVEPDGLTVETAISSGLSQMTDLERSVLASLAIGAQSGVPIALLGLDPALSVATVDRVAASGFAERYSAGSQVEPWLLMHSLVQKLLIDLMSDRERDLALSRLMENIEVALQAHTHWSDPFARWRAANEAAKQLQALPIDLGCDRPVETFLRVSTSVVMALLRDDFNLIAARNLLSKCYLLTERSGLPPSHSLEFAQLDLTARSGSNALAAQGLKALIKRQQESGDPELEVLDSRRIRGWALADSANARLAVGELLVVEQRYVDLLGSDHPETLMTQEYLAYAHGQSGDFAEAARLLEVNLRKRQQVLGSDHPDTVTSRYNLAFARMRIGDLTTARDELEVVLQARRETFGPDFPTVLMSEGSRANCIGFMGNPLEASHLFEGLVDRFDRVVGPAHPLTMRTRYYQLRWLAEAGEPVSARANQLRRDVVAQVGESDPLLAELDSLIGTASG